MHPDWTEGACSSCDSRWRQVASPLEGTTLQSVPLHAGEMSRTSGCERMRDVYLGDTKPCLWFGHELCSAALLSVSVWVLTRGRAYRTRLHGQGFGEQFALWSVRWLQPSVEAFIRQSSGPLHCVGTVHCKKHWPLSSGLGRQVVC